MNTQTAEITAAPTSLTIRDLLPIIASLPGACLLHFRRYGYQAAHGARATALGADRVGELLDTGSRDIAVHRLPAGEVAARLHELSPRADECIAFSSLVETVHGPRHLLLLDFACPPSPEAQADLTAFLERAGWRGWLLLSGASYHFVGFDFFTAEGWSRAMGKALLMPGIDVRYIGHRLAGGMGGLRITTHPRKPMMPAVIATIGSSL